MGQFTPPQASFADSSASDFSAAASPSRAWAWWGVLLIVVTVGLAYLPSLEVGLLYDDHFNISRNPSIRSLEPLSAVFDAPPGTGLKSLPFANLTYALNYAIGGENPVGYHAVNLVIHTLAVLTLFALLRRTLRLPSLGGRFAARADPLALVVALAWGLHPVQTHAVTYLSGRSVILMGLFLLLMLYCVLRAWSASAWGEIGWKTLAMLAFYVGAGCKQTMAVAPAAVLLFTWFFLAPNLNETLWGRAKGFNLAMLAGLVIVTLNILAVMDELGHLNAANAAAPLAYAITQPKLLFFYLGLLIWPDPLNLIYNWPLAEFGDFLFFGPPLGALLIMTLWGSVKKRMWAFPLTWFFLIMAPLHSFWPLVDHFPLEYRVYLASIGPVVGIILGGWLLLKRGRGVVSRMNRPLVVGLLAVWATMTVHRNLVYGEPLLLWERNVASQPACADARIQWGVALFQRGRFKEALEQFRMALGTQPGMWAGLANLNATLRELGRIEEALVVSGEMLERRPNDLSAWVAHAANLSVVGQPERAIALLQPVLMGNPRQELTLFWLADAHWRLGRLEQAQAYLDRVFAITRQPEQPLYRRLRRLLQTALPASPA